MPKGIFTAAPNSSEPPQPCSLDIEARNSTCTPHGVRVADCTTCRPGGTR